MTTRRRNSHDITLGRLHADLAKQESLAAHHRATADQAEALAERMRRAIALLDQLPLPMEVTETPSTVDWATTANPALVLTDLGHAPVTTMPFKPAPLPASACAHPKTGMEDGRKVCLVCHERVIGAIT